MEPSQFFAGWWGLMSGMGASLAYMQVTAWARSGNPEERVVFYFAIGTAVVGLVGGPGGRIHQLARRWPKCAPMWVTAAAPSAFWPHWASGARPARFAREPPWW